MHPVPSNEPLTQDAAAKKKTVYVIDDERAVASLMEAVLLEENYEVLVSHSGEEALAELDEHQHRVDLFLLDVVMPDISGPDLAQELRLRSPEAVVLFTSGHGEGAGIALKRSNPEATFLSKPFNASDLVDAVESALA